MKLRLLMLLLCLSPWAQANTYISLGYGSDDSLNFEMGSNQVGLGWFLGFGVQLDDQKMGDEGEDIYVFLPDVSQVGEQITEELGNLYLGANYTVAHSPQVRSTFGAGADFIFSQTYRNWYDSNRILGDNGYFWLEDDDDVEMGATVSYALSIQRLTLSTLYRTHNDELVVNVGLNF
ncbi:hypothetical protein VST7929_01619 [Vibrio stylophorae]|uniref:Outer membrane protein beta-barrel domain-containing protein n=1 Tax=Vibrio stylophorae TaxID=659351 RepID=A0ABM8ZTV6_9VIBR|nr:hypothetical protein [Vibrio stylophorae]CAH0533744.1 hypothetical protein VST7929_01619 [Vibrio stylophorae]